MAIEMKVTRNLSNNYVQIESSSNRTGIKHFKVPKENVNSFCNDYPKHEKKIKNLSDIIFITSVFLGCLIVTPLTKKMNPGSKILTSIIAGLGAAVGSMLISNKIENKQAEKFLKLFNAQKINYNSNNIAKIAK